MPHRVESRTETSLHLIEVVDGKRLQALRHVLSVEVVKSSQAQPKASPPSCLGQITIKAHHLFGPGAEPGAQVCVMSGYVDSSSNMARLTDGDMVIENRSLRGLGIGSYLFNLIVSWVRDFDMDLDIVPVRLFTSDAYPNNLERRNRFYEKFGLKFDPNHEAAHAHCRSLPMKTGELVPLARPPSGLHPRPIQWLPAHFTAMQPWHEEPAPARQPCGRDETAPWTTSPIETWIRWSLVPLVFCLGISLGRIFSHF